MLDETLSIEDAADAPSAAYRLADMRIGVRRIPAGGGSRGGDWSEAFLTTPHTIAVSIGDVCGHGAEQFPTMVATRSAIRRAAHDGCDAVETLARANRMLCRETTDLATAFFGLLDTRSRIFRFANAGHPPPLMASTWGTSFIEYARNDLLLGFAPEAVPRLRTIGVPESALLVFYTDGISEAEKRPLDGMGRLRDATNLAFNLPSSPTADIIEARLAIGRPRPDDASVLTLRTPGRSPFG
jgi:serine phosphatase RsbU (regulator of sigma subunit)